MMCVTFQDKKAAKEEEREEQIRQQEIENLTGVRHLESQKIKALLRSRNLMIYEVSCGLLITCPFNGLYFLVLNFCDEI